MEYHTRINWHRGASPFEPASFERNYYVHFGSGFSLEASSAPEFSGDANLPNPEELFIASISSCFMLTFLHTAAVKGIVIDSYVSEANGTLAKNAEGKMAITEVILKPSIVYRDNKQPEPSVLNALLQKAHDNCFISCSVKTNIVVHAISEVV